MTDHADEDRDGPAAGGEPVRDHAALCYVLAVLKGDPPGQAEAYARAALRGTGFALDVMMRAVRMLEEALPYREAFTRVDVIGGLQSRADYLNHCFGALFRLDADAQDAAADAAGDGDPDTTYLDEPYRRLCEGGSGAP